MDNWPDNEQWERWKNDPSKWKWGLFYYNKEDKRLVVPKKIEAMGITFNFAHKAAFPISLLIIVCVVAMVTFATRL